MRYGRSIVLAGLMMGLVGLAPVEVWVYRLSYASAR